MTREEEIKQAVKNNLDVSVYTPQDGEMLKETFYIGAKWADSNPKDGLISLSWVWHDSSEIPQHDALILFQSIYGDILLIRFQDRKSSMTTIHRWAYIDDLLPKTLSNNI